MSDSWIIYGWPFGGVISEIYAGILVETTTQRIIEEILIGFRYLYCNTSVTETLETSWNMMLDVEYILEFLDGN